MASVTGGLFHATAPTHVTSAARPTAGPLSLAQVTGGTSSGPQGEARFTGSPAGASSDQVVATQTQAGAVTTLTLHDGSQIIFHGAIHFTAITH